MPTLPVARAQPSLARLRVLATTRQAEQTKAVALGLDLTQTEWGYSLNLAAIRFQKLARESDRIRLVDMGRTEEGRTQWMVLITSPRNLTRLARYQEISRRLARAATEASLALLTPKEREVLGLLAVGLTVEEIAERLALTCKTVQTHRNSLRKKLEPAGVVIRTIRGLGYLLEKRA